MSNGTNQTALDYFRMGHDTLSIARIFRITEAEAYNMLAKEKDRPQRASRPVPKLASGQPRLVPYAGFDPHGSRLTAGILSPTVTALAGNSSR